ncbi:MAG: glutamate 5-kinase [Vampirovibrionales bacterium]|nr:glutamate 5-kinase [Vampirovibrionales bacterium]
MKRVVIKLGSQLLVAENGRFESDRVAALVAECAAAKQADAGLQVLIVTSGAVGLGRLTLNLALPLLLPQKQACAAVGQGQLMQAYREQFARFGLQTAQILLTNDDFQDRRRCLTLRDTLETLLALGVVPIINENDVVSTSELAEDYTHHGFGDNDRLSALLASELGAELLILLTSVDGIYTDNPALNPAAKKLDVIHTLNEFEHITAQGGSAFGRGGMAAKLEAIELAAKSGVTTIVASGQIPANIGHILAGHSVGTRIEGVADDARIKGRKRWIAFASGYQGVLVMNQGAQAAITQRGASLLPVGVTSVQGSFRSGQVVSLQTEAGQELGRGLSAFSADEARLLIGCPSDHLAQRLGRTVSSPELIHRDALVLWE